MQGLRWSISLMLVLGWIWDLSASEKANEVLLFEIPPSESREALLVFRSISRLQLIFDPDDIAGVQLKGVAGEYPKLEALKVLLEGSPLESIVDAPSGAIAIRKKTQKRITELSWVEVLNSEQRSLSATETQNLSSMKIPLILSLLPSLMTMVNAQTPEPSADEDVYSLSPFVIEAKEDDGYAATATLAGTRLRTDLRDVGSAITVVTEQFLRDTGSTNIEELLIYTPNTEIGGVYGNNSGITTRQGGSTDETGNFTRQNTNSRLRGLPGPDNTRDYALSDIPWDGYNVGRVEMQRGANAILFGLGSPSGVVNATLNQADFRNRGRIEVRTDQFGSFRSQFDYNHVVLKDELAVRVSALHKQEKYRQKPSFEEDDRIYAALRWDPSFMKRDWANTTIRMNFEKGEIVGMRPRVLPPIDRISAWFNEEDIISPANEIVGKPEAIYKAINRGVYNNWDMTNRNSEDPTTAFAAEAGRNWVDPNNPNRANKTYTRGYVQNPFYQPFISEVWTGGSQNFLDYFSNTSGNPNAQYATSGPTLLYGINNRTNDGFNLKATPNGIYPNGGVGYFRYAQWQAIAEPWKSYRYMEVPFGGLYRDPSLTDRNVFDYFNKSLDGDNRRHWRNFDSFNAAFDQTFFGTRMGFSLNYNRENYDDGSHSIFNDRTQTITVDVNATMPATNLPNPNAGRAIMMGDGNYNTMHSEREEFRASAFAQFKANDVLKDSWITDLLGRHVFNAMYTNNSNERISRAYRRFMLNPDDLVGIVNDLGVSGSPTQYRTMVYVTPDSMTDRSKYPNMGSIQIDPIQTIIAPKSTTLTYFDSHWKHPLDQTNSNYINPDDVWVDTYSGGNSRQRNNPDNYVGWRTKEVRILDATNPNDRPRMQTNWDGGLSMRRFKVDSKAFVWQGFLLNSNLVSTFGYRSDKFTNDEFSANQAGGSQSGIYRPEKIVVQVPGQNPREWQANPLGVRTEDGFIIQDSPNIYYQNPPKILENINRSWSVVGHAPSFIRKYLPWDSTISLTYNKSSNFSPNDAGRVNMFGEKINPSSGSTEDVGVLISMFENRLNLRVIKYRSARINASAGGFNFGQFKEIETRAWVAAMKMLEGNRAAATTDYLGNPIPGVATMESEFNRTAFLLGTPDPEDSNNRILYSSQAEKDALIQQGIAMAQQVIDNTPTELFAAWGIDPNSANWRTVTDIGSIPGGATTVQDQVSEGYEVELTYRPLQNWRLTANYSETEAVTDNTFKDIEKVIFSRNEIWNGTQGDFYYSNPGRMTGAYRDNWNTRVMSTLTSGLLANGLALPENASKRLNLVTNYDFRDGLFKGISVGGAYRWESEKVIGNYYMVYDYTYTSGGVDKVQKMEVPNREKPIYAAVETSIDFWCSYSRKLFNNKIDWRIQLNIRNLGKDSELIPISTQPDGSIANYRIQDGQRWSLSSSFGF